MWGRQQQGLGREDNTEGEKIKKNAADYSLLQQFRMAER
jgi:hypothetical protein